MAHASKVRNNFRLAVVTGLLGLMAGLALSGRGLSPQASAEPKETTPAKDAKQATPLAPSDYAQRAVAYIYGTQVVTRADLGEYLIARFGAERLDFFVNKLIIERECKEAGIEVGMAEVEAALQQDLKDLGNLPLKEFENKVLNQYRKSLYEWKEDVIRSRLMMTKLVRSRVKVTPEDLRAAFDAHHGERVEGRIIMLPGDQEKVAMKVWEKVNENEDAFAHEARHQASKQLAGMGGKVRPISRNSTGNVELEREVFSLKEGECSKLIGTPEGIVIFKCDKRLAKDDKVKLEDVRAKLEAEIIEKKIQQEIPVAFQELRKKADAKVFLKKYTSEEEWLRDIRKELQAETSTNTRPGPVRTPPAAN